MTEQLINILVPSELQYFQKPANDLIKKKILAIQRIKSGVVIMGEDYELEIPSGTIIYPPLFPSTGWYFRIRELEYVIYNNYGKVVHEEV